MLLPFLFPFLFPFLLISQSLAQQYAGDPIANNLPSVPGSEIAFFKIPGVLDSNKKKPANLTLINYYSHGSDGKRLVESKVQRAVVVIHGLHRDPGTYEADMLSALALEEKEGQGVGRDSVAVMAPYFPNGKCLHIHICWSETDSNRPGDDKTTGYPWTDGLPAQRGSTTSALVWKASQWSAGANNQYPYYSQNTSSYAVLDAVVQYFDDRALFPNMKQIVVAGHSLGAQTVQRYAAVGQKLNTRSPVTYWIGNPNSYVWLSTERPASTASCPTYDYYREGFTNFTEYPMTYGQSLVSKGRLAILANYNSKQIAYARGMRDLGDDSSGCAPATTGGNRNERFFNFIKAFPPSCSDPRGPNCDTVDLVNMGHDGGGMMASPAGRARLFTDNFFGDGNRSYDFGYPRQELWDDPFPDPALNMTARSVNNNTYDGNLTYAGCYSDSGPSRSLSVLAYETNSNTIELCTSTCVARGYSIAGLEYGSQCFCGNSVTSTTSKVIESSCTMPCSGNSSQSCGGGSRLSIYSNGNPYILPPPSTPETIGSFYSSGCFTEPSNGDRALSARSTAGSSMTLEYCASFCASYKFFGTEFSSECYCSNALHALSARAPAGDCGMTCANNSLEFCGGGNRLTLYSNEELSPPTVSSTSSTTSTTSTSAAASSGLACPAANNTLVISRGLNFTIECGIDHVGGDLTSLSVDTFRQCIDACAAEGRCVDVSLSGSACYLKSVLGPAVANGGVWGARLLGDGPSSGTSSATPSSSSTQSSTASSNTPGSASTVSSATPSAPTCPASNNTAHTASSGRTFAIECGVDHQAGDMGFRSVGSFQQCIEACDQTPGCVDVSLSGSACYLKSSVGAAVLNGGVWGARLVTEGSSSAASSADASASLGSTSRSPSGAASTASSTAASSTPAALTCPASNSTTFTAGSGKAFLIECGIDHRAGDLSSRAVGSFGECVGTCDATPTCVCVAFTGRVCYLKSEVGEAVGLQHVWGARVVGSEGGSTASFLVMTPSSSWTATSGSGPGLASSASTASSANASTTGFSASSTVASSSPSTGADTSTVGSSVSASSLITSTQTRSSALTSVTSNGATVSLSPATRLSTSFMQSSSSSAATPSPVTTSTSSSTLSTISTSTATSSPTITSSSSPLSPSTTTTTTSFSFSISTSPSTTPPLPSPFTPLGCYPDTPTSRALPISGGTSSTQTPYSCALSCRRLGAKFSGTEYASECWCGNALPRPPSPPKDCSTPCAGDRAQQCGAGNRLSVVEDAAWTQTLFARENFGRWGLVGCFRDSVARRSLPGRVSLAAFGGGGNASVGNCLSACGGRGLGVCGVEYGEECWGSASGEGRPEGGLRVEGDVLQAGCGMACRGNGIESCGGSGRVLVYELGQ